MQIYVDEELTAKEKDTLPDYRIRPCCVDDSAIKSIKQRTIGDPVDCWDNDLWWEGYVHQVWDDEISVYFPSKWLVVEIFGRHSFLG